MRKNSELFGKGQIKWPMAACSNPSHHKVLLFSFRVQLMIKETPGHLLEDRLELLGRWPKSKALPQFSRTCLWYPAEFKLMLKKSPLKGRVVSDLELRNS